jgi:SNF2 family DNA or RNA helicase
VTKITILGEHAKVHSPMPLPFVKVVAALSGKKLWDSAGVRIEASPSNIRTIKESGFQIDWTDDTGKIEALRTLEGLATQHQAIEYPDIEYTPAMPLFEFQKPAVAHSWDRQAYAYLLDMGLGKSAITIANIGMLHTKGKLTGALICSPRGVHRQWIKEQFPRHLDPRLSWSGIVWQGKVPTAAEMNKPGLTVFSMNTDALRTQKGYAAAEQFLNLHHGRSMMVMDESQMIKGWQAARTGSAVKLGQLATYRRISTGTPIANDVLDLFTQFEFLNPDILGHKYITTFKSRYCVFGGWNNKAVVAHKNIEELYSLIAPHSYRLTQEEAVDLPPEHHSERAYEMDEKTKHHYKNLKKTYMTMLDSGELIDVANAAVCMMRLQQVVCGHLPDESGVLHHLSDDRIKVLKSIIEQTNGSTVIWARFVEDAWRIRWAMGNENVAFYRGNDKEREEAKQQYLSGERRFFVANQASGGTGLDGLQDVTRVVIYYSNDFSALNRWQSWKRTRRVGTKHSVQYFDIVAERSVDKPILRTLQNKKSISDLTLDQIRQAISE